MVSRILVRPFSISVLNQTFKLILDVHTFELPMWYWKGVPVSPVLWWLLQFLPMSDCLNDPWIQSWCHNNWSRFVSYVGCTCIVICILYVISRYYFVVLLQERVLCNGLYFSIHLHENITHSLDMPVGQLLCRCCDFYILITDSQLQYNGVV